MTLVKILKREKDTIHRTLVEAGYHPNFYTIEKNDQLLQMELPEGDPGMAFLLGKLCGHEVANQQVKSFFF